MGLLQLIQIYGFVMVGIPVSVHTIHGGHNASWCTCCGTIKRFELDRMRLLMLLNYSEKLHLYFRLPAPRILVHMEIHLLQS